MLPYHVILTVFAALVSQGNVAVALPHGTNQFNARSERVNGNAKRDVIDAAAKNQLRSVEVADIVARGDLLPRTSTSETWSYIVGAIGLAVPTIQGVKWAKSPEGGRWVKASKAKITEYATALLARLPQRNTLRVADIEMALSANAGVAYVESDSGGSDSEGTSSGSDHFTTASEGAGSGSGSDSGGSARQRGSGGS